MVELENVKALLGVTDDTKDALIQFALDNAEETILNYCNIETVPEGLEKTQIRMAMDIYRNETLGTAASNGKVSSLSEGDTSISYGSQFDDTFKESILKQYNKVLNRYRRVVFP